MSISCIITEAKTSKNAYLTHNISWKHWLKIIHKGQILLRKLIWSIYSILGKSITSEPYSIK